MDTAFALDVASLCLRWLHLIVGIAWIGSSLYFVWLDNSIRPPKDPELIEKGVLGELWAMHAGGFYNPQKYVVAPKQLPETLHWFFWPSYSTFITGFLLMTTLYYLQASYYMIDPAKAAITPLTSVIIGLATLAGGWLFYDMLARLLIDRSQMAFAVIYTLFVTAVSYALNQVLSGRAAYIHVGAMMGASMTGNVFFIIIPAQRIVVGAMKRGETPDAAPGKRAKQRSVHNNYLTMPVLFAMISNHYSFTYSHPMGWLALIAIMVGSAIVRHFFNLRHKGSERWEFLIGGCTILFTTFLLLAPWPAPGGGVVDISAVPTVAAKDVQTILATRCITCHGPKPTIGPTPAAGLLIDTPEHLLSVGDRAYRQVVAGKTMPLGNVTQMTQDERLKIAAWIKRDGVKKN